MECFFCRDIETIRGVTPCCYQAVCESCFNDEIDTCTCGQPFSHYLLRQEKQLSDMVYDQVNQYIENKNAYLVLVKDYHWKIHTITIEEYTKESNHAVNSLLKLCKNYSRLVENNIFVEPPSIPTFVPLGVCKRNTKSQWCVVSKDFDHFLEKNCDYPWDWQMLSWNPNLSFQYVLDHPEKSWCWSWLSSTVSFQYVLDHPELPWDCEWMSINPNLPFQYVLDHPEKSWGWSWLSENLTVKFQDILDHPEIPWNWHWLSKNPNVPLQYVLDHPELPWNWCGLSQNNFDLG